MPNSVAEEIGEGSADLAPEPVDTLTLMRLEVDAFSAGETVLEVEVRLAIRGIFVGVSFDSPVDEFNEARGGPASLPSLVECPKLPPTEGDPAMVGS